MRVDDLFFDEERHLILLARSRVISIWSRHCLNILLNIVRLAINNYINR